MPARKPGPSVKDPEMYEALRDDGASKEKAARISNAAATLAAPWVPRAVAAATTRTGRSGPREAGARARDRGSLLDVKAQLVKALREH